VERYALSIENRFIQKIELLVPFLSTSFFFVASLSIVTVHPDSLFLFLLYFPLLSDTFLKITYGTPQLVAHNDISVRKNYSFDRQRQST
jgi:hypothetical protein